MNTFRTVWKKLLVVLVCMYSLIFVISNQGALKFQLNKTLQESMADFVLFYFLDEGDSATIIMTNDMTQ